MMSRLLWTTSVAILLVIMFGGASWSETRSNQQIIIAIPRERRLALAEKLADFDRLGRQQQDAIRRLDDEIQKRPTEERERYYAVARRYHLALNSLTLEQRQKVQSEPETSRINLLLKYATLPKVTLIRPRQMILDIEPTDFLTSSPYEFAHEIRFWIGLSNSQQADIQKLLPTERLSRLRLLMRKQNDPGPVPDPTLLEKINKRQARPAAIQKKFADLAKSQPRIPARYRDAMILGLIETPKVAPADLDRYEAAIPSWLRESLDPLPPDSLHKRLAVLYRIAYPPGVEMPRTKATDTKKVDAPKVPATSKANPANF